MATLDRQVWIEANSWRTLVTLWNTNAIGVFLLPSDAEIKVRYGNGWPFGKDRQKHILDGTNEKRLIVSRWSILVARMQIRVQVSTNVSWRYIVEGP
jgi:hypothetical protein